MNCRGYEGRCRMDDSAVLTDGQGDGTIRAVHTPQSHSSALVPTWRMRGCTVASVARATYDRTTTGVALVPVGRPKSLSG
jgi:hypothetical protein